jgi:hypothetical protein
MNTLLTAGLALAVATHLHGESVDTAIVAAMSLAEQPNYSWTSTIVDDAQTYDIEGKTERGGFTWQRQPMPPIIARRLGRRAGHELEAIFSDRFRYVVQTDAGWKLVDELPKRHDDWRGGDWYVASVPLGRTADMPGDANGTSFGLPPAIYIPVIENDAKGKVFCNAQFALALPQDELSVIVSSHTDLQVEGDVVSGNLTDLGAQLLLVHDGHEYIRPVTAGGRFKLWLKRGTVEKYLIELAGIVVVERKAVYVRQKSTTRIKDVGTTAVQVPPEARRRL